MGSDHSDTVLGDQLLISQENWNTEGFTPLSSFTQVWAESSQLNRMIEFIITHSSMNICVYLPKREELSLRTVLAFPNDSNRGVASSICTQTQHTEVCPYTRTLTGMASKATREQSSPQSDGRRQEKKKRKRTVLRFFKDSRIDNVIYVINNLNNILPVARC